MTGAVAVAVRERIDRVRQQSRAGLADRLIALGRDGAERLSPEYRHAFTGADSTRTDVAPALA